MKILLDTHLLLWWLSAAPQLSPAARDLIEDPENTIFISSVSHWEIWLKASLGKLRLPAGFQERLRQESFEPLPLTADHTKAIAAMPWLHRDPFDRMLIAQAQTDRLVFLTADEPLAAYGSFVKTCLTVT